MSFVEDQAQAWREVRQLFEDSHFFARPLETMDGPGATVESTARLRGWLQGMMSELEIGSMVDAACGDWNWMRLMDLTGVEYLGWDVDEGRIDRCQKRIVPPRANVRFEVANLLTVPQIPKVDLILCRHMLQHLPQNDLVAFVIDRFRESGSTYLLTTTFPGADNSFEWDPYGSDHAWRGYFERSYDLTAPPFSLAHGEVFTEELGPGGILTVPHQLALFTLN